MSILSAWVRIDRMHHVLSMWDRKDVQELAMAWMEGPKGRSKFDVYVYELQQQSVWWWWWCPRKEVAGKFAEGMRTALF